jgi:hypothetical protein
MLVVRLSQCEEVLFSQIIIALNTSKMILRNLFAANGRHHNDGETEKHLRI